MRIAMKRPNETTRAVAISAPRPVEAGLWLQLLAAAALVVLSFAVASALR
jgi:hypothetical protein